MCGQEDEGEEQYEDVELEVEHGSRKVQKVQDPREPSKEERLEHEMTHLPFRSWCRHCIRGRGE